MQDETLLLIRDLVNEETEQLMQEGEMPHAAYVKAVRRATGLLLRDVEGLTTLRLLTALDDLDHRRKKNAEPIKRKQALQSMPHRGTKTRDIYDWAATVSQERPLRRSSPPSKKQSDGGDRCPGSSSVTWADSATILRS